jgi:hypothetical protein
LRSKQIRIWRSQGPTPIDHFPEPKVGGGFASQTKEVKSNWSLKEETWQSQLKMIASHALLEIMVHEVK